MQSCRVKFVDAVDLVGKFAFVLLCLAALSLPLTGCSKPVKKEMKEEKKVVQEMNIQIPDETVEETAVGKKENEVESLPFESGDSEKPAAEEHLPDLGGGN